MSKKDYYIIEKNVSKVLRDEPTNFLDMATYKKVISKLKGITYNTYYPYKDSDKVIIYTKKLPQIKLIELTTNETLTHRMIMGSLFGLNIDSELFGDIIITNNHYYIMVMESIYNLIVNEYHQVGHINIKLKEVPLTILNDYERKYEIIEIIVSSTRIDSVICRLIGTSRDQIKKKFIDNEVILNYETCHRLNYVLKEDDVFSIRKYGKYKYGGIIKETKKENYLIRCYKYSND